MKKKFFTILLAIITVLSSFVSPAMALESFKSATLVNYKTGYRIAVHNQKEARKGFAIGYELDKNLLGFSVVTNYSTNLSSSITATQTTLPVGTTKDKKGTQLATSTLGMKIYLNIEPGGAKEELVVCTGISGNNWTGCTRGLAFSGTNESAVSAYQYPHSQGVSVVMSNIHYVYQNFVDKESNETVGGAKTFTATSTFQGGVSHFTNIPTTSTTTPSSDNQLATKLYVDSVAISGGANASTSTKGISYLSSDPSIYTNPIALNSEEVATTTGANKVVRASSTGLIDDSFINKSLNNTWTGNNNFSGITTLSTTTFSVSPILVSSGSFSISATTTEATTTIYHNLGKIPYNIRFNYLWDSTSSGNTYNGYGNGDYNSSTSTSMGIYQRLTDATLRYNYIDTPLGAITYFSNTTWKPVITNVSTSSFDIVRPANSYTFNITANWQAYSIR